MTVQKCTLLPSRLLESCFDGIFPQKLNVLVLFGWPFCSNVSFWTTKTSFQSASADSQQLFRPLKWTFVWTGKSETHFVIFKLQICQRKMFMQGTAFIQLTEKYFGNFMNLILRFLHLLIYINFVYMYFYLQENIKVQISFINTSPPMTSHTNYYAE